MAEPQGRLQKLFQELRRRRVLRVAGFYLVVGWLVVQIAATTFPFLQIPDWAVTLVIVLVALGFPVAVTLAWLFDATPHGIERTASAEEATAIPTGAQARDSAAAGPAGAGTVSVPVERAAASPWLRAVAVAVLLVVLAGGAWAAWLRFFRPPAVSGEALAVLPFSVQGGPGVKYLGQGLVDIMSRNLDGAAGMHTVNSAVVLRDAQKVAATGPIDPDLARRIAGRVGAGVYLLGNVQEAAGKLRMSGVIYTATDTAAKKLANAEVDGDTSHVFAMVDALSARLMAALEHGVSGRLAETAAMTTRSLPALRYYLEGEQALRAAEFDTAIANFQSAVAEDSTFALAYYRLGVAGEWGHRMAVVPEALDNALKYSDRLDDRDRRLVEAAHDFFEGRADQAEAEYRAILAEYPGDLDAQFQLASLLYSDNPRRGRPMEEARAPFDNVLAADPKFICPI